MRLRWADDASRSCIVVKLASLTSPPEFDNLRVVLIAARNPLNIGAAARAMSNFGFFRLRVVKPFEVAFREARSAVGAGEVLARAEEFESVAGAVADCTLVVGTTSASHRGPQQPLKRLDCRGAGSAPPSATRSDGVAVWFGKSWTLECRSEPLPLAATDTDSRRARVDEPGTGRGRLSL